MPGFLRKKLKRLRESGGSFREIMLANPEVGKKVLQKIPELDSQLGREFRDGIIQKIPTFSKSFQMLVLDSLPNIWKGLGHWDRQRCWLLFLHFQDSFCPDEGSIEASFMKEVWKILPNAVVQNDDDFIKSWVNTAEDHLNEGLDTALSLLKVESRSARELYSRADKNLYLRDIIPSITRYAQAHSGEWSSLITIEEGTHCYTDGFTIFLPASINDEDGQAYLQYRLNAALLAAYFEFGSFEFAVDEALYVVPESREEELDFERFFRSFPNQQLAKDVFFILEEIRLTECIKKAYPGISSRIGSRLSDKFQTRLRQPNKNIISRCLADIAGWNSKLIVLEDCHTVVREVEVMNPTMLNAEANVSDTITRLNLYYPKLYGLMNRYDLSEVNPIQLDQMSSSRRRILWLTQQRKPSKGSVSLPKRIERVQEDLEEQFQQLDRNPATTGSLLDNREESEAVRSEVIDEDTEKLTGVSVYPEWDMHIQDWKDDWTRVLECELKSESKGAKFVEAVTLEYGQEMKRIRALFQQLSNDQRQRQRGVTDGDRLEFDRVLDARIQRRMKQTPSDRLYSRQLLKHRDPAVAFLVDLSSSTNEITEQQKPILDIEKSALLLMAEALDGLGDPFAIYGWSGFGRRNVVFYSAKELDEPWGVEQRNKVGAFNWKMENRDGAAIRHVCSKMSSWTQQQRLLIILSDGKPLDCGGKQYYDEYAQADTKQALIEARQQGIIPFCVTVDPYGQEYLAEMYGPHRFITVDNLAQFPQRLARLYTSLTSD